MSARICQLLSGYWPRCSRKSRLPVLIESEANSHLHSQIEWEAIVVDDNSPDGTQEVAKQLAKVYGEDKIVSKIMYSLPFWMSKGTIGSKTACWKTRSRVCRIFLLKSAINQW